MIRKVVWVAEGKKPEAGKEVGGLPPPVASMTQFGVNKYCMRLPSALQFLVFLELQVGRHSLIVFTFA